MEPSAAQKNAPLINEVKSVREDVQKLIARLQSGSNARKTSIMISLLEEVDHHAIDRLVELGLTLKVE